MSATLIFIDDKEPTLEEHEWWIFSPDFFPYHHDIWIGLKSEIIPLVVSYDVIAPYQEEGKTFPSRRLSCKMIKELENHDNYTSKYSIPIIKRDESPMLCFIWNIIESFFKIKFDYCLCHLYRDGNDLINWHRDNEAMKSTIVSVSVGATRKFRFRKNGQTKGYEAEFNLESGSLLLMRPGCQQRYIHSVPQEKRVKHPRINLTFRQFE